MGRTLREIEMDIKELSISEKEILAQKLFKELESIDPEIEKSWMDEADRRWQDIESAKVKTVPGHIVRDEARNFINE